MSFTECVDEGSADEIGLKLLSGLLEPISLIDYAVSYDPGIGTPAESNIK